MTTANDTPTDRGDLFSSADWYDRTINWDARVRREVPVLTEFFGPPGEGGLLDAGCGPGHQARAMAARGYRMVAADVSEEMLEVARRRAEEASSPVRFVASTYESLFDAVGGGFDGVYCLGNALAAAGTRQGVARAIEQFARCLRTGGKVFVQVLNFPPMRKETPCVRGPRVSTIDGREYVSVRQFHFSGESAQVTSITIYKEGDAWRQRANSGTLYPVTLDELRAMCASAGLHVENVWSNYAKTPFDPHRIGDLILTATSQ